MRGLIIEQPWIDYTLDGLKPFEIQPRPTKIRERIGLICAGTGEVWGEADLTYCEFKGASCLPYGKIHSYSNYYGKESDHDIAKFKLSLPECHHVQEFINFLNEGDGFCFWFWKFENIVRYDSPRKYKHPQGAQTWVKEIELIKE